MDLLPTTHGSDGHTGIRNRFYSSCWAEFFFKDQYLRQKGARQASPYFLMDRCIRGMAAHPFFAPWRADPTRDHELMIQQTSIYSHFMSRWLHQEIHLVFIKMAALVATNFYYALTIHSLCQCSWLFKDDYGQLFIMTLSSVYPVLLLKTQINNAHIRWTMLHSLQPYLQPIPSWKLVEV